MLLNSGTITCMKKILEWIYDLWLEVTFFYDYHTTHRHTYSLSGFYGYKGDKWTGKGIPVVAWAYTCKCGEQICELTGIGVDLMESGVKYDELINDEGLL